MPQIHNGESSPNTRQHLQSAQQITAMHLHCFISSWLMIAWYMRHETLQNSFAWIIPLYLCIFDQIHSLYVLSSFVFEQRTVTNLHGEQHCAKHEATLRIKNAAMHGKWRKAIHILGNSLSKAGSMTAEHKRNRCKCEKCSFLCVSSGYDAIVLGFWEIEQESKEIGEKRQPQKRSGWIVRAQG